MATPVAENSLQGWGVHVKPDGPPLWLWLRWIAEDLWVRDWPRDWNCWRSIRER